MKDDILSKKLLRSYGYSAETKDFHFFLTDLGSLNVEDSERPPYKIEIKTNKDGIKYQEVRYTPPTTTPHDYYIDKTGKEVSGKTIVSPDDAVYNTYLNKKLALLTKDGNLAGPTAILKENQQKIFNIKQGKNFSVYLGYGEDAQIDWNQVRKQLPDGLTVTKTGSPQIIKITDSSKTVGNYTAPITLRLPKKIKLPKILLSNSFSIFTGKKIVGNRMLKVIGSITKQTELWQKINGLTTLIG